ncbi:hypothetical protein PanWU01x14_208220, partial [Parasponia andersonii]
MRKRVHGDQFHDEWWPKSAPESKTSRGVFYIFPARLVLVAEALSGKGTSMP